MVPGSRATNHRSGKIPGTSFAAARYSTLVLAAMEVYISNPSHPPFKRLHCGYMLLKSWGSLRYDDVQRIRRHMLRPVGSMIQTELLSSKTSGPGRRVKQLPMAISFGAQLLGLDWLKTFMHLLNAHLPAKQEFLMEACTNDFQRSTGRELRYYQAAALSKVIVEELRTPIKVLGIWTESDEPAAHGALIELFSEHSGRSVVPSLSLFVEEDKSKRDMVGRWRPSGADD